MTGGTAGHFAVCVTALNYFGETVASAISSDTTTSRTAGFVADVTITAVPGAQQYNIYVSTNATVSTTTAYLQVGTSVQAGVTYTGIQTANSVGGIKFTLQGALATANHARRLPTPGRAGTTGWKGSSPPCPACPRPVPDPTPTSASSRRTCGRAGTSTRTSGPTCRTNAIFTALDALWENNGMNNVTPGVYRADPSEIVADGGDLMRLANDILSPGRGPQLPPQHLPGPDLRCPRRGCGGRVRQPGHQVHAEAHRAPLDVPGHCPAHVLPAARRRGATSTTRGR